MRRAPRETSLGGIYAKIFGQIGYTVVTGPTDVHFEDKPTARVASMAGMQRLQGLFKGQRVTISPVEMLN